MKNQLINLIVVFSILYNGFLNKCNSKFLYQRNQIIDAESSLKLGAKLLAITYYASIELCSNMCCDTPSCSLFAYKKVNLLSVCVRECDRMSIFLNDLLPNDYSGILYQNCYLFDCGKERLFCKHSFHPLYVIGIKINGKTFNVSYKKKADNNNQAVYSLPFDNYSFNFVHTLKNKTMPPYLKMSQIPFSHYDKSLSKISKNIFIAADKKMDGNSYLNKRYKISFDNNNNFNYYYMPLNYAHIQNDDKGYSIVPDKRNIHFLHNTKKSANLKFDSFYRNPVSSNHAKRLRDIVRRTTPERLFLQTLTPRYLKLRPIPSFHSLFSVNKVEKNQRKFLKSSLPNSPTQPRYFLSNYPYKNVLEKDKRLQQQIQPFYDDGGHDGRQLGNLDAKFPSSLEPDTPYIEEEEEEEAKDNFDPDENIDARPSKFLITKPKILPANKGQCNPDYEFKCLSGSPPCIAIYDVCDKIPHCEDGSDEIDCPRFRIQGKYKKNESETEMLSEHNRLSSYIYNSFSALQAKLKRKKRKLLIGLFTTAALIFLICLWLWRKGDENNSIGNYSRSLFRKAAHLLASGAARGKNLRWRRGIRRPDKRYYVNGLTLFEQYDREEGDGLFKGGYDNSSESDDADEVSSYFNGPGGERKSLNKAHPVLATTTTKTVPGKLRSIDDDDLFRKQDYLYSNVTETKTPSSKGKIKMSSRPSLTGKSAKRDLGKPAVLAKDILNGKRNINKGNGETLDLGQRFEPTKNESAAKRGKNDFKAVSDKLNTVIIDSNLESPQVSFATNSTVGNPFTPLKNPRNNNQPPTHFLDNFAAKTLMIKRGKRYNKKSEDVTSNQEGRHLVNQNVKLTDEINEMTL